MVKTTITITPKVLSKLVKVKYKYKCKSMNEVVKRLLKILTKLNLGEEFKEVEKKNEF